MVDASSILGVASKVMWSLIAIIAVGLFAWFIWTMKKYNREIIIMDETAGGNLVRADKACEYKDDKGILCWKIKKEKIVMPCPPKGVISIKGGKKFAVLVRVQGDQYHWLNSSNFRLDAETELNKANPNLKLGKYFVISEDAKRQLADQFKKAEHERTTKLNSFLQQAFPIVGIAIMLIGCYFIYDVVGTKLVEVATAQAGVAANLEKASSNINNALLRIEQQDNRSSTNPAQNVVVTQPGKVPN